MVVVECVTRNDCVEVRERRSPRDAVDHDEEETHQVPDEERPVPGPTQRSRPTRRRANLGGTFRVAWDGPRTLPPWQGQASEHLGAPMK